MPMHAGQVCIPWVLILTHPFKHPPQNSGTVPVCAHVFCLVVRTGALPARLPTRRNWSSVFTVTYGVLKVWTHLGQESGHSASNWTPSVLENEVDDTLSLLNKKKNSSAASKMQNKWLKDWLDVVLSSNYKPMKQMLRHRGRSIICVGLLVVALSIWVYVVFFFHRVWLFSHAMSQ